MRLGINSDNIDINKLKNYLDFKVKKFSLLLFTRNKKRFNYLKEYNTSDKHQIVYINTHKNSINYLSLYSNMGLISLIQSILRNENTALLYDRFFKQSETGPGVNNYFRYITNITIQNFHILSKYKPDYMFFDSTPHNVVTWVFGLVADNLDITMILQHGSVLPWRTQVQVQSGFKSRKRVRKIDQDWFDQDLTNEYEKVEEYISQLQSTFEETKSYYKRLGIISRQDNYFNLINDLKRWWYKPNFVFNKYNCLRCYKNISKEINDEKNIITYFLHFQPERTSLPEGFGFTQQMIAIKALRISAPSDIEVVVKEHPATFKRKCDPKQRHPSFYKEINSLQGVRIVTLNTSSFELIDKSMIVSTLTGTIGVEALLRGTPIIYFGLPKINKHLFGMHKYKNEKKLSKFINSCMTSLNQKKIKSEIQKYLKREIKLTVPLKTDKNMNRREQSFETRYKILEGILLDKIQI